MVDGRQLLERMAIIPRDGICLDGIYLRGDRSPSLLVVPTRPGSMESAIVSEAAYAAADRGFASLRFNFQGIGASEGERTDDPDEAVADLLAARNHLLLTAGGEKVAVCGIGSGAAAAWRFACGEPGRVDRLILVGPETADPIWEHLRQAPCRTLILYGELDDAVDPAFLGSWQAREPKITVIPFPETTKAMRRSLSRLGAEVGDWLDADFEGRSNEPAQGEPNTRGTDGG